MEKITTQSLQALIAGSEDGRLLPCPHCGFSDELYPAHHDMGDGKPYAIDCLRCGADFEPRDGMDVVAAWNKRDPVIASIAEELLRARKAMEWQPIETAPRDGTRILIWSPMFNGRAVCASWDDDKYSNTPRPFWRTDSHRIDGLKALRDFPPLHWRSLPPKDPTHG